MTDNLKKPALGKVPYFPPKAYCLATDYEAAHPGFSRYSGGPCKDCVPVEDYELIRFFLLEQPDRIDDLTVPGLLGIDPEIYARVVTYFRLLSLENPT